MFFLEPVFAALLVAWLFGETVAPLAIAGGALVIVAVATVLRQSSDTSAKPGHPRRDFV